MGVASLDRDADTSPNIDDLDQLAGTATDYDLVQWRSNGQRYTGVQPSQLQVKPLSGTALLTLEDYLNGVVDARFYGFGKSGNTPAQNATALAAAGAAAQGKVLLLPNQTVTVTGTKATAIVTVGASGMKIIGAGGKYGSVIAWDNLNDCVIFGAVDRDNVVLHGVGFDGGVTAARVPWQRAFVFRGCQRVEVTDCWFYRMGDGAGIIGTEGFHGSDGVGNGTRRTERMRLCRNLLESCWGSAGLVTKFNGSADFHVDDNISLNSCGTAISIESEDNLSYTTYDFQAERGSIKGNVCLGSSYLYTSGLTPAGYGISISEKVRRVTVGLNIVGDIVGDTLAAGIIVTTSPSQSDQTVGEIPLSGNTVFNVTASGGSAHSYLFQAGDASLYALNLSNNISYGGKYGYTFESAAESKTLGAINDLTATGNTAMGATGIGYFCSNVSGSGEIALSKANFVGNRAVNCASHGFSLFLKSSTFSANIASRNGGTGVVFMTGSKQNSINASHANDNGLNGFEGDFDQTTIDGNLAFRNGQAGVIGYGCRATAGNNITWGLNRFSDDGVAALAIGSTTTNVAYTAFKYYIGGVEYSAAGSATGIALGTTVVPVNKYGCIAFEIGTDGTVDVIEATNNATGYNTAALAIAGLPSKQANHTRFGNITVMRTGGSFTFGTTALNDGTTTTVYTSAIQDYGIRSANNGQTIRINDIVGNGLATIFGGIGNHNTGTYDAGLNRTA